MAAAASVDLDRWRAEFDRLITVIAPHFPRIETRRTARELVLGLMAELPRLNCWTLAEHSIFASCVILVGGFMLLGPRRW